MSTYSVILPADESSPQGLETTEGKTSPGAVPRYRAGVQRRPSRSCLAGQRHLDASKTDPRGPIPPECYQRRHAQALTSRKATPDWAGPNAS